MSRNLKASVQPPPFSSTSLGHAWAAWDRSIITVLETPQSCKAYQVGDVALPLPWEWILDL